MPLELDKKCGKSGYTNQRCTRYLTGRSERISRISKSKHNEKLIKSKINHISTR